MMLRGERFVIQLKDPDIRLLLKQKFATKEEFINDPSTIIVDEFDVCLGAARIDVAVVNGKLHGYEIKSERDNLERLPSQIESYNKVFDTLTLVVSNVHLEKAKSVTPKWWGIECVSYKRNIPSLKTIRKPKVNKHVQGIEVAKLLWRDELIRLLEQQNIKKGIKSKTRMQLGTIANEFIDQTIIAQYVRSTLKSRQNWKAVQLPQPCDDLQ